MLTVVVMYAAIGLQGLLIFLFGIIFLILLQAGLVFRYIVNENKRAKDRREALEKEKDELLEDFSIK